jgi:uncharacterized protein (TIGR03086 family)
MSVDLLKQSFASTASVLDGVSKDQLDLQTPCRSWTVRELVNHVVGGSHFWATVVETGGVEAGRDEEANPADGDFASSFREGADKTVAAFSAPGAMEKMLTLPFGQVPGSAFLWIAAGDSFTHGWDLAKATGQSTDLDPVLASTILEAITPMLPDAMRGDDGDSPFGPKVEVAASAPAVEQLVAFLGRQP